MSGGALIAGKITVELNADATRKHFGGVVGVVGFAGLSHPNYKPTMGGRCIGTRGMTLSPSSIKACP